MPVSIVRSYGCLVMLLNQPWSLRFHFRTPIWGHNKEPFWDVRKLNYTTNVQPSTQTCQVPGPKLTERVCSRTAIQSFVLFSRLKRDQDCDPMVFPVDLPIPHNASVGMVAPGDIASERLQVLGLQKLCFKPCLAHVFEVLSHNHTTINRSSPEWLWLQLRTRFETMHAVAASPRLTCGPGGHGWRVPSKVVFYMHTAGRVGFCP